MAKPDERRKYARLRREEKAVIRRLNGQDEEEITTAIYCKTVDVSAAGMQVRLKPELKPGEPVDIIINMEGYSGTFHLLGATKWCRHLQGEEECLVGIELMDAERSDFISWRQVFN
ncbi:MAG: PilZ domain-containing protein [Gammaproteobacteria bacterium]|nr:PilZ domain-containing protein [Gammaproteobacteria bacterium]